MTYVPIRPALWRTTAEAVSLFRPPGRLVADPELPRGRGRPVLFLPPSARGDSYTAAMRAVLERLGHRTFGWGLGVNLGPTPGILAGLDRRLLTLHAAHGRLDVAGFSLGGVFARHLAHRHPDMVRQVATVCSPFRQVVDSVFLPLRPVLRAWRTPDLLEIAAIAAQPLRMPGTFIFSRNDGIVAWESCVEPLQPDDCFEISGPHMMLGHDQTVLAILARRFARDLGP